MPDVSARWAQLLSPALSEAFYIGYADQPASMIDALFGVKGSVRADEQHLGRGVLSSQGWNFKDGGRVKYDERHKGFPKTFTHATFAKGFVVERELIEDQLTGPAFDDSRDLGIAAFKKREMSAASVFNNAFTSTTNDDGYSTLGPDSVVLCSASHPRSAQDSTTWSNAGTSALSKANVATTRVSMLRFTDDRGDISNVMPDLLLVPPELEDTGIEITKSMLDPTSGNNAVNPQAGRFRLAVWHYLTDTNNWFMAERQRMKQSLLWYNRVPLQFFQEGDFDTFQAKFAARMRYSYGWHDASWIYGHAVT